MERAEAKVGSRSSARRSYRLRSRSVRVGTRLMHPSAAWPIGEGVIELNAVSAASFAFGMTSRGCA